MPKQTQRPTPAWPLGDVSESLRRISETAELIPQALWVQDEGGRLILANRAMEELWQCSREDLCGEDLLSARVHPDDRDDIDYTLELIPDHRIVRPSGEVRWIHVQSHRPEPGGTGTFRVFTAQDITDYHRLTEELRRGESDYRLLIETQEQMIVKVDPAGRFLYVSPNYCETFGKQENELLGRVFMPLVHEDDREGTSKAMERLHTPPHTCYLEQRALTAKGWRWLAWNDKAAVNERGEILYIVGVGRDITERRKYREELARATADAQRANREKDSFLAMLSHELRTPLTPVLASVSAIEHDHSLPPELHETLQMIRRNIELESRLIDDLLDLTRISRGKLRLEPSFVDAHELLQRAISVVMPEIQGKSLHFTRELSAKRTRIFADASRIQQVFWNVIRNAVQYTPPAGHVSVRTIDEKDSLIVQVTDDGAGIDAAFLPRIFDAFEQEMRGRRGGLGLGLAISRTVLDLHGGTITAESPGLKQGSRFIVTIPLAESETVPTDTGQQSIERAIRVLLVEDHPATVQVLCRLLTKLGHQVTTAMNLQAAMQTVAEQEFDLLISDIGLPDGSGLDLMKYVRQSRPMPGIALSGFGMDEDVAHSREAGFQAHLTKPVGVDLLVQTIGEVVREQHRRPEPHQRPAGRP